jgi:hypothetical protein
MPPDSEDVMALTSEDNNQHFDDIDIDTRPTNRENVLETEAVAAGVDEEEKDGGQDEDDVSNADLCTSEGSTDR